MCPFGKNEPASGCMADINDIKINLNEVRRNMNELIETCGGRSKECISDINLI